MLHILGERNLSLCHWDENGRVVKRHKVAIFKDTRTGKEVDRYCIRHNRSVKQDLITTTANQVLVPKENEIVCKYCKTIQPLDARGNMFPHQVGQVFCRTFYRKNILLRGEKHWTHKRPLYNGRLAAFFADNKIGTLRAQASKGK